MSETASSAKLSEEFTIPKGDIAALTQAEAYVNDGAYQDALYVYNDLMRKSPNNIPALLNMGVLFGLMGNPTNAELYLKAAVEKAPDHPMVRHYYALNLLSQGELEKGWDEFKWREKRVMPKTISSKFGCDYWEGQDLKGKFINVLTEQGIGDEIMCLSMVPDLIKAGATVSIYCSEKLIPIVRRSFPDVWVHERESYAGDKNFVVGGDYKATIAELGKYLRPSFTSFPIENGFLKPNQELVDHLRKDYKGTKNKPLIGIAWRSPGSLYPKFKSTDLRQWEHILYNKNVQFVSLQYGDVHVEVEEVEKMFKVDIIEEGNLDNVKEIDNYAAQIAAMDLVISVSNTAVHLAGAMEKLTWNIAPAQKVRMWYWSPGRSDTPWYPTMWLIHNHNSMDTLATVAMRLQEFRVEGN